MNYGARASVRCYNVNVLKRCSACLSISRDIAVAEAAFAVKITSNDECIRVSSDFFFFLAVKKENYLLHPNTI